MSASAWRADELHVRESLCYRVSYLLQEGEIEDSSASEISEIDDKEIDRTLTQDMDLETEGDTKVTAEQTSVTSQSVAKPATSLASGDGKYV